MTVTPILDLEKDPPKPRRAVWRYLIWLAVGTSIGLLRGMTPNLPDAPSLNLFIWIVAIHVMILLHEMGHLAAGHLVGLPPGGIRVGCFTLIRSGERWIFRFDLAGFASGMAIPLTPEGETRISSLVWMVAGGPIVSVVLMAVCWVAWNRFGDGSWDWIGSCWWAALGCLSCLIPMSFGTVKSDISRLWMFWRAPGEAKAWIALVAVSAENLRGVRPRDWTRSLVEEIDTPGEKGRSIQAGLLLYCRCWDEGDVDGAVQHLEDCLAASKRAGKMMRQALYLEAATVSAFRRQSVAQARTWRERARNLGELRAGAGSAAAIAICEGRYEDALKDIDTARQYILKRNPGSGLSIFVREQLDLREEQCRAAIANGAANAAGA
jgi:hypothetical protein